MGRERIDLTSDDEKLASSIAEMTKQDLQEIRGYLSDPELRDVYLRNIKSKAELGKQTAEAVLNNLNALPKKEEPGDADSGYTGQGRD